MHFLTRLKGIGRPPWAFRGALAAIVLCLSLAPGLSARAALTHQMQNLVPALYSFDSGLALLGLRYGVDPSLPAFTASGTVTDAGFSWATGGLYLGSPFALTASGTFDVATNSTSWTGSGSYGGTPWSMEGLTKWSSQTDFAIKDSISIGGVLAINSGGFMTPDFNFGTMTQGASGIIDIKELATRHWLSWLFGASTDGWVVTVQDPITGLITTNVYSNTKDSDKVGVKVDGTGTIEFAGSRLVKVGFIKPVPEPATWEMMLLGFFGLGTVLRRQRRASLKAVQPS